MKGWLVLGALCGVLLFGNADAMHGTCQVIGMVYGSEDITQVDAALRDDEICNIKAVRFERHLVFVSPRWRVEVDIPKELKGWVRFRYSWGHMNAYFGTLEVPVIAGPQELS